MKIKSLLIVGSLFLGVFVVGADSFIISPLLPNLATSFQTTISGAALGVTAYALTEMVGAPVFGPFGDRFSKRRLLLTGISLFLLATLLCGFATNPTEFYLFRGLAGLGAALFLPNVWAFIGSYFEIKTMNKVMGIVMSALSLSVALGVPLGSFLASLSNWRMAFWASAALTLLALLILILVIPGNKPLLKEIHYLHNFKQVFATNNAGDSLLVSLCYMFAFYLLYTFLGTFLTVHYQMDLTTRGLIFLVYGLANFLAAIFGGNLMNKIGRRKSILLNASAAVIFSLGIGLLGGRIAFLLIFLIGLAFAMGLGVTAISAQLVSLAPENRSTLMSLNSSVLYLGLTLGSSLGGLLFQRFGFGLLGMLSALSFLASAFIMRQQKTERP